LKFQISNRQNRDRAASSFISRISPPSHAYDIPIALARNAIRVAGCNSPARYLGFGPPERPGTQFGLLPAAKSLCERPEIGMLREILFRTVNSSRDA